MKQRKKAVLLASVVLLALVFAGCVGPFRSHEPPPAPQNVRVIFRNPHGSQIIGTGIYTTANQITITWDNYRGDAWRGIRNHRIERSNSALGPWYTISFTRSSYFTDTGLSSNTTWFYRVINICLNGLESIPSAAIPGTTLPLAPIGVTATALSRAIQISWTAATGVTHHRIEWSTRNLGPWSTVTGAGSVTGTSFTHSNLSANDRRYYRVIAINSAGHESAPSTTVSATSLP